MNSTGNFTGGACHVSAIRNFKFLGFCFGKNGKGIYIRVHGKSWKKAKDKLRQLTSRSRCGSIIRTMGKIKTYMRGWLNYYGIADMKNDIKSLNGRLCRRIRMCIWKQWKQPISLCTSTIETAVYRTVRTVV